MRPSTTLRAGAVLTATALSLSLGTGPVSAADDAPATVGARFAKPAPAVTAPSHFGAPSGTSRLAAAAAGDPIDVTTLQVGSGLLYREGNNPVAVTIEGQSGTGANGGTYAKTEFKLRVGKKTHTGRTLYQTEDGVNYFNTKSGWGAGQAQLLETKVTYTDGTSQTDSGNSNTFYVRSRVRTTADYPLTVRTYSPGNKIKFFARTWKVFKPSKGAYRSLGKIRLQYKKSGSWKTLKTIELDSKGNGSWTTKISGTRTYRLFVPKTSTVAGGSTESVTASS